MLVQMILEDTRLYRLSIAHKGLLLTLCMWAKEKYDKGEWRKDGSFPISRRKFSAFSGPESSPDIVRRFLEKMQQYQVIERADPPNGSVDMYIKFCNLDAFALLLGELFIARPKDDSKKDSASYEQPKTTLFSLENLEVAQDDPPPSYDVNYEDSDVCDFSDPPLTRTGPPVKSFFGELSDLYIVNPIDILIKHNIRASRGRPLKRAGVAKNSLPRRKKFGALVLLFEHDYQKFCTEWGKELTDQLIEDCNKYLLSKGQTRSDYVSYLQIFKDNRDKRLEEAKAKSRNAEKPKSKIFKEGDFSEYNEEMLRNV